MQKIVLKLNGNIDFSSEIMIKYVQLIESKGGLLNLGKQHFQYDDSIKDYTKLDEKSIRRDDPNLVSIVEKLCGTDNNLRVVEIPDNNECIIIQDITGKEHVVDKKHFWY
jgi:hypothetical protein